MSDSVCARSVIIRTLQQWVINEVISVYPSLVKSKHLEYIMKFKAVKYIGKSIIVTDQGKMYLVT